MPEETSVVTPTPTAAAAPEPQMFSREYVQELRHESAAQRTARKASDDKLAEATAAVTAATAEAEAKIAAATQAANERILRSELKAEAMKAGMVDLDGLKLADLSKVKLNEAGEVEGAEALMTELKKAKPYLFGAVGSTSLPSAVLPKPGVQTHKRATEMSKAEYDAARADIRRGILPKVTA
jgi:hypothetical protein